ncbi:hypothetical protein [Mesorhizobium sp. 131-2-1]|uniref:hypothetical protein n=1 Tax=Mesorhizobium sp. 131-2-1 TaxID=2744518 RepID=UPI0019273DF2|nr:hypothetical protein [Mesorhizobium sp. 131-2-1]BCG96816.1 hypothetical protein MesoLj131a_56800 [Mesorhizobium sp. 131-2-1]
MRQKVEVCEILRRSEGPRLGPYMLNDGGSAKETLDGIAANWKATIAEHGCN